MWGITLAPITWDKFDRELQPNVVEILAPVTWDKFDRESSTKYGESH